MSYNIGALGNVTGGTISVGNGKRTYVETFGTGPQTSTFRAKRIFINGQARDVTSVAIVDGDIYVDDQRLKRSCNCPLTLDESDTASQRRLSQQHNLTAPIELTVRIEGAVKDKLELVGCDVVTVSGSVGGSIQATGGGNITTGDVNGSVSTQSGNVTVNGNIQNSVTTDSGYVEATGSIGGSVSTMSGDIRSRR